LIRGDAKSASVAAASIVAKVTRDHLMQFYARIFPGYGFEKNDGYGTKQHLEGLENKGVTPIHRQSFEPVKKILLKRSEEHTSELQSRFDLVCRLLLEKKKNK